MGELNVLLERYPELKEAAAAASSAVDILIHSFSNGGKLLLCGNGGSAADCEHISGELLKGFRSRRSISSSARQAFRQRTTAANPEPILESLQSGLPAIPLTSLTAASSAFANDVDPRLVYAQLVYALGKPGDVLMAISTSGNAENVVAAAATARGVGMDVVAMTGEHGGELAAHCTCLINAPVSETYLVQELHLPLYHYMCLEIEHRMFGSSS